MANTTCREALIDAFDITNEQIDEIILVGLENKLTAIKHLRNLVHGDLQWAKLTVEMLIQQEM